MSIPFLYLTYLGKYISFTIENKQLKKTNKMETKNEDYITHIAVTDIPIDHRTKTIGFLYNESKENEEKGIFLLDLVQPNLKRVL
jgi:hypothetical protein